jgi:hypothetical protein
MESQLWWPPGLGKWLLLEPGLSNYNYEDVEFSEVFWTLDEISRGILEKHRALYRIRHCSEVDIYVHILTKGKNCNK